MTGTLDVPECPALICADGFGRTDAITLTLEAPNQAYNYRANLSLELRSQATSGGGIVVLYLDVSADGGANFTNRAKNSHQIGNGMGELIEGRQAQVFMPLTSGASLGVSSDASNTSLQLRARAQLISGNDGIVEVFSNAEEAGDGFGDCPDRVTGLNGTIHLELEEVF
jgi:hypothetical protein